MSRPVSVVIPARLSHTGEHLRRDIPIDDGVAEIVMRLNDHAHGDMPITIASCDGHGMTWPSVHLVDGDVLLKLPLEIARTLMDTERERRCLTRVAARLPCVVCLAPTLGGDPCHLRAKRRFGDWLEREGRTVANIFPACREHHRQQHDRGILSFQAIHGLDLDTVVVVIGRAYLDGHEPETLGAAVVARGYVLGLTLQPGIPEF